MSNEKTMDFSHNFTSGLHAVMQKKNIIILKSSLQNLQQKPFAARTRSNETFPCISSQWCPYALLPQCCSDQYFFRMSKSGLLLLDAFRLNLTPPGREMWVHLWTHQL